VEGELRRNRQLSSRINYDVVSLLASTDEDAPSMPGGMDSLGETDIDIHTYIYVYIYMYIIYISSRINYDVVSLLASTDEDAPSMPGGMDSLGETDIDIHTYIYIYIYIHIIYIYIFSDQLRRRFAPCEHRRGRPLYARGNGLLR